RTKTICELLISASKAEREETRLKVRQDSLRLGSVVLIRAGTVLSEDWKDGPVFSDLNAEQTKEIIKTSTQSIAVFNHKKEHLPRSRQHRIKVSGVKSVTASCCRRIVFQILLLVFNRWEEKACEAMIDS
ncbi:serine/threonine-protein kinase TOUSLED-like, partial [Trifolium medium]|nr:serine/threonine-protein kinase TOUSLED-like [Trifolium medium]